MSRRFLPVLLLSLASSLSPAILAQEAAAAPAATQSSPAPASSTASELTLEECIARALQKNFALEVQRITTSQAKENVIVAESAFDSALQIVASRSTLQRPDAVTTVDGITTGGSRNDADSLRAGVTKTLATGATVNASTSLDRGKSSQSQFLNPAYNGDVSFSITQPLLRGGGTEVNRAAIRRAEIGVDRSNLDLKGSVLDLVRDVEEAYYNLVYARGDRAVRDLSLQLAQQLVEENEIRRQVGSAIELDILTAQVGVANARRNVLLSQQTVNNREDALLQLIGQFEFNQHLGTVAFPVYEVPEPSFDTSYKLARDNDPSLASQQASVRQLEIDTAVARRNRLPSLDLGGAVGLTSREGTYQDAATHVWDGDGYDWQVDLTFRMPWRFRGEKARYRIAQSSAIREEVRFRQLDQALMGQVRSAVRAVQTNKESVSISALATSLSARQYDLERERLKAGLSTSRRVLEAQDDLESARVSELQSKVALRIAMAELQRLEGTSLARFKINVNEVR
ncbi:MAG: TolC family protein [Opitutaceae bacterium]|nr:TolC family protein [Opitutaceae bacterium]